MSSIKALPFANFMGLGKIQSLTEHKLPHLKMRLVILRGVFGVDGMTQGR